MAFTSLIAISPGHIHLMVMLLLVVTFYSCCFPEDWPRVWTWDDWMCAQGGDTRREEVLSKGFVDISIHINSHASVTAQN